MFFCWVVTPNDLWIGTNVSEALCFLLVTALQPRRPVTKYVLVLAVVVSGSRKNQSSRALTSGIHEHLLTFEHAR